VTYLIRGTVLSGVGPLIVDLGGDPEALLRSHRVDLAATEDFEQFVSYTDSAAVFGDAARLFDCPDFGMRIARRQSLQALGPVGVILRNAETVGDALDSVCRFLHNIAPMDTAQLIRTDNAAIYSFDTIVRNTYDRNQLVEKSIALAMKTFTMMLGDDFVPTKVTFRHGRIGAPASYHEVFGRVPDFDAERNSIHLPLLSLRQRIPDRDPTALALAENYLTRIGPEPNMADHVREITRRLLFVNQADLIQVARAMSLHPRAVQRQLAGEGTSFEKILDDIRKNMAMELSATGIQVSQIARTLGYAEQSSYTRACRRWFGVSPRQLKMRMTSSTSSETLSARKFPT
jgi:AraC-like DNA-binding protein